MKVSGILLFILILGGFLAPRCGALVFESNGSVASVQALHNAAHDGDTITLPAGTFSWPAQLNITKGIRLQGATTIIGAGTSTPTINDATIIKDNTPRSGSDGRILNVDITSTQSFRMTGITFVPGNSRTKATTDGAFHLISRGSSPNTSIRIDHCHFASLHQTKLIWVDGWIYGVADHNVFDLISNTQPFYVTHSQYGGTSQIMGNGAWADYPWFGTEKLFFI
jgi:hypothetical protein